MQSYDVLLQLCCRMGRHAVEALNRTVLTFQQCTRECREAPEPAWGSSTGSLWHVMGALWYLSVWVRCRGVVSSAACLRCVGPGQRLHGDGEASDERDPAGSPRSQGRRARRHQRHDATGRPDETLDGTLLAATLHAERFLVVSLDGGRAHALHGKPRSRNARPRPSRECHAGARARRYVANRTRC